MKLSLSLSIGSVVSGAASRILNLWNKLSRNWAVETRDWDNIT
tara:strand:+ start:592 stop:720 length:129 start_codon:yes stop_codon:yes gene_type:complete